MAGWLQNLWAWQMAKADSLSLELTFSKDLCPTIPLTQADASVLQWLLDISSSALKNWAFPFNQLLAAGPLAGSLGQSPDNSALTCMVLKKLSHTSFVLITTSRRLGHPNAAPLSLCCHVLLYFIFSGMSASYPVSQFQEKNFKGLQVISQKPLTSGQVKEVELLGVNGSSQPDRVKELSSLLFPTLCQDFSYTNVSCGVTLM